MRRPPKFSWVVDGLLAAQGRPTLPGHLQYLCENNVKYIVTLTKTKPRALLDIPGCYRYLFIYFIIIVIIVIVFIIIINIILSSSPSLLIGLRFYRAACNADAVL